MEIFFEIKLRQKSREDRVPVVGAEDSDAV